MLNCNNTAQYIQNVTTTETNVSLTVTNSTNISSLDNICLIVNKNIGANVTGAPLPVQVVINGTAVNLLNKYSLPVLSDKLPCRQRYCGAYVAEGTTTPYVILFDTPKYKCNA